MPSLIVLDVDGTLTKVRSSWQYLHENLGIWDGKAEEYQEVFRRGEITYREFCELDADLWGGIPLEDVLAVIETIGYRENIEDFFSTLNGKARKFALVSTGLGYLVNRVKDKFGIDYAFSNHLLDDGKYLTGEVRIDVDWGDKPAIVKGIKDKLSLRREEVVIMGDSDGDVGMFGTGGFCIAVEPSSPKLRERAHVILEDGDLVSGARIILERYS
jgi:phosphoserine phosphatase